MKTIKSSSPTLRAHFGGLPSAALKAMVAGLLAVDKSKTQFVDMDSFGRAEQTDAPPLCFGCAVTWSLQAALGRPMTPEEVDTSFTRRKYADQRWSSDDVHRFECAIDAARQGDLSPLFRYMRKVSLFESNFSNQFHLATRDWRKRIPAVRKLIRELAKKGL